MPKIIVYPDKESLIGAAADLMSGDLHRLLDAPAAARLRRES
jgi:hypothetical protein